MPVLIAILTALGTAYFFFHRARNAAAIATDLLETAGDVRNAARRFGFRRRANTHPIDNVDEPKVLIAGIACAFLELDDLPTADQRREVVNQLQSLLGVFLDEAEELMVFGRWLSDQCKGNAAAINRMARRLHKIDNLHSLDPLMSLVQATVTAAGSDVSNRQRDAIADLKRGLKL